MNKFALTTLAPLPRAAGFAQALEAEVGKERAKPRFATVKVVRDVTLRSWTVGAGMPPEEIGREYMRRMTDSHK